MGSQLYLLSGFRPKSFIRTMTMPMYSLSMKSITDMIKHSTIVILSRGTINGALILLQSTPICMEKSSLAPKNVSGIKVVVESRSIVDYFCDFFSRKTEPETEERQMGWSKLWKSVKIAFFWFPREIQETKMDSEEFFFLKKARVFSFLWVILQVWYAKNNGGRA